MLPDLFISACRFEKPAGAFYAGIVLFLLVLPATVLPITYMPVLSTGLIGII